MPDYVPALPVADLPPTGFKAIQISGTSILIGRAGQQLFACVDRCPHAGVPLRLGKLCGEELTCQRHGWTFDVLTGKSVPDNPAFCLTQLAVKIEGEHVLVGIPPSAPSSV